jgi:hypothetical protein
LQDETGWSLLLVRAGTAQGTNGYNAQEEIAHIYAPGRRIGDMLAVLQALVPEKLVPDISDDAVPTVPELYPS